MIVKTFKLPDDCLYRVRAILADQKPKAGYTFDTATARFAWKAATALRAIMTVEADRASQAPDASERKRLLDRYQKALELIAGTFSEGRDGELLKSDPYNTVWAEIESAMHQVNMKHIPDLNSFRGAATNIAEAVSQVKREGQPGSVKGLSGREQAVKKALEAWQECFESEITTSETSPIVRALHCIEHDIRASDPGIGATREAVRNVVGKRGKGEAEIPAAVPTETHDLAKRNQKLREAYSLLNSADRDFRFRTALADLDTRRKAGLIDGSAAERMSEWERLIIEALNHGPRPMVYDLRTILSG